jgi:acyl-coenzyme A thioesterase PaaI-like protein
MSQTQKIPEGWVIDNRSSFMTHIGPILRRGSENVFGFIAEEKHNNVGGVTHGGVLVSMLDSAMGRTVGAAVGGKLVVTIQLNTHFIASLRVGDFSICESEIIKVGGSMVFVRGTMRVDDRVIATGDGVWKILDRKPSPPKPI